MDDVEDSLDNLLFMNKVRVCCRPARPGARPLLQTLLVLLVLAVVVLVLLVLVLLALLVLLVLVLLVLVLTPGPLRPHQWLEIYPEFKASELYLTGESYAGIYVPLFAEQIVNYNAGTSSFGTQGSLLCNP